MLHSAGKLFLLLSVILTGCAPVGPSPRNLTRIAARVGTSGYSGSAFLYRGRVITAGHICDGHTRREDPPLVLSITVGDKHVVSGHYVPDRYVFNGMSAEDACVLRPVLNSRLPDLEELVRAKSVHPGDAISIVGSPLGFSTFRTDGYVASLDIRGYIGVSAAAAPGNSGSPVVNQAGEIIGILNAGLPIYDHLSLVTPISVVDDLIDGRIRD